MISRSALATWRRNGATLRDRRAHGQNVPHIATQSRNVMLAVLLERFGAHRGDRNRVEHVQPIRLLPEAGRRAVATELREPISQDIGYLALRRPSVLAEDERVDVSALV